MTWHGERYARSWSAAAKVAKMVFFKENRKPTKQLIVVQADSGILSKCGAFLVERISIAVIVNR
jgi:hypothetical protein